MNSNKKAYNILAAWCDTNNSFFGMENFFWGGGGGAYAQNEYLLTEVEIVKAIKMKGSFSYVVFMSYRPERERERERERVF